MFGYLVRRIIAGITVLFMVTVVTFALFFIGPSDPVSALCGQRNCTPSRYHAIEKSLGMNKSKVEQYADFVGGLVAGRTLHAGAFDKECPAPCFGYSFIQDRPVTGMLLENIPVTFSIAAGASVIYLTVGVLLGVYAAINRGTAVDKMLVGSSLTISSFPFYILALLAYLNFAVKWGIFPRTGYEPLHSNPFLWAKGLLLAWLVLGLFNSTQYARFSRASMVEALGEDFVRTARSKGLSNSRVYFRHGLRAAIAPVVTIFGLDLANLLSGTIFAERIFDLHGIGYLAVDSVETADLPVIMGTVMFAAVLIVAVNIIVDLLYGVIDPRVRLG